MVGFEAEPGPNGEVLLGVGGGGKPESCGVGVADIAIRCRLCCLCVLSETN